MGKQARMRVVYFFGEGLFSPVLDSCVLIPLRLLGKQAPHAARSLVVLTSARFRNSAAARAREAAVRASLPGVAGHFRYRPPTGIPLQRRLWAKLLRRCLRSERRRDTAATIVHCIGEQTGAAAVLLAQRDRRVRVLVDVKGLAVDEVPGSGLLADYRRWFAETTFRAALQGADAFCAVSRPLAECVVDALPAGRRRECPVVPCCVDARKFFFDPATRSARRSQLGLTDKFVVCYCGSAAHWQRPDALAAAFAAIRQDMPDAHMLAITAGAGLLREHLARVGVNPVAVTTLAAPHDEVPSYLMAADMAMLLREDIPTNRVAWPVKFGEYLRCGVPVILTPYIGGGELGALVTRERIGATVAFPVNPDEVRAAARAIREQLRAEGDEYRQRCSRVAGEAVGWESQLPKLIEMYETLARQVTS